MKYDRQTIYGQPPSKSNRYRIIRTPGGKCGIADSPALLKYEQLFFMQCGLRNRKISQRFRFDVDVYFSSDRPDLDNSLKVILDCLQKFGAIKNDRLCVEIHARKLIDKKNPRIEFTIEEIC